MSMNGGRVCVVGDVTRDRVSFPVKTCQEGAVAGPNGPLRKFPDDVAFPFVGESDSEAVALNCQFYPAHGTLEWPGGAALTAEFIRRYVPPESVVDGSTLPLKDRISSHVTLDGFSEPTSATAIWRVSQYGGYDVPTTASIPSIGDKFPGFASEQDIVVMDDAGNGFRHHEELGTRIADFLAAGGNLILKLSRPIRTAHYLSCLSTLVKTSESSSNRGLLIIIVDIRDLRAEGLDVSRGLSWERTAVDITGNLLADSRFDSLMCADYIVARADLEGALICDVENIRGQAENPEEGFTLIYDPVRIEGDMDTAVRGRMVGYSSAFTAAVCGAVYDHLQKHTRQDRSLLRKAIQEGCQDGLVRARRLLVEGYGPVNRAPRAPEELLPNEPGISGDNTHDWRFFLVQVRPPAAAHGTRDPKLLGPTIPSGWRILGELKSTDIGAIAERIVTHGAKPEQFGIPIARFGGLAVADRFEAEGYRAIRGLMREYLEEPNPNAPLCIAVFGQPGCGKSFGVKHVAKSVFGKNPNILTFNLSEFTDVNELTRAFHLANDATRKGVPLVFFDEFDSTLDGRPLAWLKHFLAPMQDGKFRDGGDVHPIGKSILVFAGGTRHSFAEFSNPNDRGTGDFSAAKGPDFLSRLRGYVNVVGPDYQYPFDFGAMIRRAVLLYERLIQRQKKLGVDPCQHLRRSCGGKVAIDPFVLKALLRVRGFHHGMRSLTAIIDMSRLSVVHGLEPAALPSKAQLDLHVDADEFLALMKIYAILCPDEVDDAERIWDTMARGAQWYYAIGQYYDQQVSGASETELYKFCSRRKTEVGDVQDYWDSNVQQVAEIPKRVIALGYQVVDKKRVPSCGCAVVKGFTPEQVFCLAREEHARWIAEKLNQGWRYARTRVNRARLHNLLVPWDALSPMEQRKDIDAVAAIPELLDRAGFALLELNPFEGRSTRDKMPSECRAREEEQTNTLADDSEVARALAVRVLILDSQRHNVLTIKLGGQQGDLRDLPGVDALPPNCRSDLALIKAIEDMSGPSLLPGDLTFVGSMPRSRRDDGNGDVTLFFEVAPDVSGRFALDQGSTNRADWLPLEDWHTLRETIAEDTSVFLDRWWAAEEFCQTSCPHRSPQQTL